MRKNTMSTIEFILYLIFFNVVAMIYYRAYIFRCLWNFTYSQSRLILWGWLVFFALFSTFILFRNQKNGYTLHITVLLGYGINMLLLYWKTLEQFVVMGTIIVSIVSLIYCLFMLLRKIKNKQRKKQIIKNRLVKCKLGVVAIFCTYVTIIMSLLIISKIFNNNLLEPSVAAIKGTNQSMTINSEIDSILLLQEDKWKELSVKEKLNVLQIVANIEANYLGLSNEVNVSLSNFDENVLGAYDENSHSVKINIDYIENAMASELLKTCCHEMYHSYQYHLVEAYKRADNLDKELKIFDNAKIYMEEFSDYKSGDDDPGAYYYQSCEMDARFYAMDAVEDYYYRIDEYLNEAKNDE